jgi:hypothetical protein
MKLRSYIPPEIPPSRFRPRTQIVLIILLRLFILSLILIAITVVFSLFSGWHIFPVGLGVIVLLLFFAFMMIRVFINAFKRDIHP